MDPADTITPNIPAAPLPDTPSSADEPAHAPVGEQEAAPASPTPNEQANAQVESLFSEGEGAPDWADTMDTLLEREGKTSWSLPSDLAEIAKDPQLVQKYMHNMRNMGTKGRADVVRREQSLSARETAVAAQVREMDEERARLYAVFQDDRFKAMLAPPEDEAEPDYFKDPGAYAQHQAMLKTREMLGQFLENIGTVSNEAKQQVAEALAAHTREERLVEVRTFIEGRDDFAEHEDEIEAFLNRVDFKIPVEEAYEIIRAQKGINGAAPRDMQREARRGMRRGGTRGQAQPLLPPMTDESGKPVLRTAQFWQDWFEKHPGAQEAYLDRKLRRGTGM